MVQWRQTALFSLSPSFFVFLVFWREAMLHAARINALYAPARFNRGCHGDAARCILLHTSSFLAIALALLAMNTRPAGGHDVGASCGDARTTAQLKLALDRRGLHADLGQSALGRARYGCAWRVSWGLTMLRGGDRDEQTPPPPGLPKACQSPTLSHRSLNDDAAAGWEESDEDNTGLEQGEWWLRAFACFFCGQGQMIKDRRRERLAESEREQEAVREIARLFRKVFAIDDSLDFPAFLRGAQEGRRPPVPVHPVLTRCAPRCHMQARVLNLSTFACRGKGVSRGLQEVTDETRAKVEAFFNLPSGYGSMAQGLVTGIVGAMNTTLLNAAQALFPERQAGERETVWKDQTASASECENWHLEWEPEASWDHEPPEAVLSSAVVLQAMQPEGGNLTLRTWAAAEAERHAAEADGMCDAALMEREEVVHTAPAGFVGRMGGNQCKRLGGDGSAVAPSRDAACLMAASSSWYRGKETQPSQDTDDAHVRMREGAPSEAALSTRELGRPAVYASGSGRDAGSDAGAILRGSERVAGERVRQGEGVGEKERERVIEGEEESRRERTRESTRAGGRSSGASEGSRGKATTNHECSSQSESERERESSRGKATTNHEPSTRDDSPPGASTRDDSPPGAFAMSAAWLLPSLEHFLRLSVAVYGCAMCM